jgi:hypothetical protein
VKVWLTGGVALALMWLMANAFDKTGCHGQDSMAAVSGGRLILFVKQIHFPLSGLEIH